MDPIVRRFGIVLSVTAALACADAMGPGRRLSLVIAPVFSSQTLDVFTGDLDELHVRVTRLPSPPGTVVFDDTVAVDTAGNADLAVKVALSETTERFEVLLEGIRSSDGAVLYTGADTVTVNAGVSTAVADVPVSYVGPCGPSSGCTLTAEPQDTSVDPGSAFAMRILVDSARKAIAGVPVVLTNLTPQLIAVKPDGFITVLTATTGGLAQVIAATSGAVDTLRVNVTAQGLVVTPSFVTLTTQAPANAIQFTASVPGASWVSGDPSVATVDPTGLVTAKGRGTAVIVASFGATLDSAVVAVSNPAPSGDAIVVPLAGGQPFATAHIGKPFAVDVVVDLKSVPTELLQSYQARLVWNAGMVRFDSSSAGPGFFTTQPAVSPDSTGGGALQFGDVNPIGAGGAPTLIRLWFTAVEFGVTPYAVQMLGMTAAGTGTDFVRGNRVIAAPGGVTILP
ncbi:MAG TPA: hypothetical protein VLV16_09185 [Gemmatimonadales bacterium]|nr:hypothetical protein [Gemmatimonadales bacterium]